MGPHDPFLPPLTFRAVDPPREGLDVQHRCAIKGIETYDDEQVLLHSHQPDDTKTNGIRAVWGAGGKYAMLG